MVTQGNITGFCNIWIQPTDTTKAVRHSVIQYFKHLVTELKTKCINGNVNYQLNYSWGWVVSKISKFITFLFWFIINWRQKILYSWLTFGRGYLRSRKTTFTGLNIGCYFAYSIVKFQIFFLEWLIVNRWIHICINCPPKYRDEHWNPGVNPYTVRLYLHTSVL